MIKLLKFYLLNRVVKNPVLTAQIYNMIYHKGSAPKIDLPVVEYNKSVSAVQSVPSIPKVQTISRRQELTRALNELKNKSVKTKQDKESIGVLEAVLKNEQQ